MVAHTAIAHLSEDGREHSLEEHLRRVGKIAADFAATWGASDYARLAGELHDLGKYAADFQAYIRAAQRTDTDRLAAHIESEPSASSSSARVDHSTAGALHALEAAGPAGALLAFVIAGHHTGLANHVDLKTRLGKDEKKERLNAARRGAPPADLLLPQSLTSPFERDSAFSSAGLDRKKRRLEFWTRMLFSALCDADFLDTEEFFDARKARERDGARAPSISALRTRLKKHVDDKEHAADTTVVNSVRREIRSAALASAALDPGVFALTVPTGGGKTLAGMEFALQHAISHKLRRVIVAVPFTSILEQNADVYREVFGDDNAVLEHHSNFDPSKETPRSRLAAQNWDAPIVVTTTVQLFESLFARRTSRCRKLHNLARSVIVLDEAQTMPVHLLAPTLEVLGDLVRDYGTSLVISTATQPALGRQSFKEYGLEGVREIVPASIRAFQRLKRVSVRWPQSAEPTPYESLAMEIAGEPHVLAITHKRNDARHLTELLDEQLGNRATVHLSASMCAEHRTHVLAEVRRRMSSGKALRLVSTQLVEAGVDLDFPIVYRAMAGLDSMAQAAGRCNREGKLPVGELRVFIASSRPPPGVLRAGLAITEGMLRADSSMDLLNGEHYRTYFERLYATANNDEKSIQPARAALRFEDVAAQYRMIEDGWSTPVVVQYGRANALLEEIKHCGASRERLRALGRFTVNAPATLVTQWIASGHAIHDEENGITSFASHVAAYDGRFGLVPERVTRGADVDALVVDG